MYELLEAIKIGFSLLLLSYASWQDYISREVSNKVWVLYAPSGLTLTLLQIFLTQQNFLLLNLALSFLVVSGISLALFYLGFFGGADAKAFICISVTFPFGALLFKPYLKVFSHLFSLSIFDNAILTSALIAIGLIVYNFSRRIKTGERLYDGLEHESNWKKFLAIITGYKVELSKVKTKPYLVPLEEVAEKDGKFLRVLRVFVQADEDREARIARINGLINQDDKIWVTPNLPFIIFITLGLVVTLLLGDIILWLTTLLINL